MDWRFASFAAQMLQGLGVKKTSGGFFTAKELLLTFKESEPEQIQGPEDIEKAFLRFANVHNRRLAQSGRIS